MRLADEQTTILVHEFLETYIVVGGEFVGTLEIKQSMQFFLLILRHRDAAHLPQGSVIKGRQVGEDLCFFSRHIVKWWQTECQTFLEDFGQWPVAHLCQFARRAVKSIWQFKSNRLQWYSRSSRIRTCD